MANTFGYTPEEMRSVGEQLKRIKAEMGDAISTAKSAVDGLIGSGFTSAAASGAYSEQFIDLSRALEKVSSELEPAGTFLIEYAHAVEDLDTQARSQLG